MQCRMAKTVNAVFWVHAGTNLDSAGVNNKHGKGGFRAAHPASDTSQRRCPPARLRAQRAGHRGAPLRGLPGQPSRVWGSRTSCASGDAAVGAAHGPRAGRGATYSGERMQPRGLALKDAPAAPTRGPPTASNRVPDPLTRRPRRTRAHTHVRTPDPPPQAPYGPSRDRLRLRTGALRPPALGPALPGIWRPPGPAPNHAGCRCTGAGRNFGLLHTAGQPAWTGVRHCPAGVPAHSPSPSPGPALP